MHDCPYGRVVPRTNAEFWRTKRRSNVERDRRNIVELESAGWKVLTVWECMTKPARIEELPKLLSDFLRQNGLL